MKTTEGNTGLDINSPNESTIPSIAVISVASTVVDRETNSSLEEMIFRTTTQALANANLTIADIESVVISGNDQIDGRVISIMPSAGPSGGVNRDTTMIASSADHALIYGYLRIRAGQGKKVLVAGWAKPSESIDPDRAELMSAEPYILRPIGMNNTIAAALQATSILGDKKIATDSAQTIAWPLTRSDLPARGDSVFAIILAADGEFKEGTELAWIQDAGWSTASYEIGWRDLSEFESLKAACDQIVKRHPSLGPSSWQEVEIGGQSEYAVQHVCEILPLPADAIINRAGSLSKFPTSPYVHGLARMVAAIRATALAKKAGKSLINAGIGFNGFAGQGASVMVFGTERSAQ